MVARLDRIGYGSPPVFDGRCKLTGTWSDDAMLEAMHESIEYGNTLRVAFNAAADQAVRVLESEQENYLSDERITEELEGRGDVFQESGEQGL